MKSNQSDKLELYRSSFVSLEQRQVYAGQLKEFRDGERFVLILVSDWSDHARKESAGAQPFGSDHLERVMAAFLAINFALMFDGRRTLKNIVLRASPGGFDDGAGVFGAVNYLNALSKGGFADLRNFPQWMSLLGMDREIDLGRSFLERFYKFIDAIGQSSEGSETLQRAEVFVDLSEVIDEYISLAQTRYFENPLFGWKSEFPDVDRASGSARHFKFYPPDGGIATKTGGGGRDFVQALRAGALDEAVVEAIESAIAVKQRFRGLLLDLGGAPREVHLPFLIGTFRVLSDAVRRQV